MKDNSVLLNESAKEVQKTIYSACRMLAIREHSHQQMREKLYKKGFSRQSVEHAIDYLVDENWISEARFCESFIRSKSAKGQGLNRIVFELQKQGIEQSLIDKSLLIEPVDWQSLCVDTLEKKIRVSSQYGSVKSDTEIAYQETDSEEKGFASLYEKKRKQRIKLESFLNYRGFNHEEIRVAMKKCQIIER